MWPFQRNQLTSDHVERADTVKKNQDERNVWLPNQKSMMSFVSKTVDQSPIALGFDCISQPWDNQSTEFEFGSHQYRVTRRERFE